MEVHKLEISTDNMSISSDRGEGVRTRASQALRRAGDRLGPLADSAVLETRRLSTRGIETLINALEKLRDRIDPDKPETEAIADQTLGAIINDSNKIPVDTNPTPVPVEPTSSPPAPATPSSPEAGELDSRFRLATGHHYIKGRADQDAAYHQKLFNGMELALVLDGAGRGYGSHDVHPEVFVYNTLLTTLESIPSNNISEETIKTTLENVHNNVKLNFQGVGHAGVDMVLAVPGNDHPFLIHIGEGNSATIVSSGISRLFNPHRVTNNTPNARLIEGVWRTARGSKALNIGVDSTIAVEIKKLTSDDPIIIASDGFWDMFDNLQIDNKKVISLIIEGKHDEAAEYLATTARNYANKANNASTSGIDDIAVMIVKPSASAPNATASYSQKPGQAAQDNVAPMPGTSSPEIETDSASVPTPATSDTDRLHSSSEAEKTPVVENQDIVALRAEITSLRAEMRERMAQVLTENNELATQNDEIRKELSDIREENKTLKEAIGQLIKKLDPDEKDIFLVALFKKLGLIVLASGAVAAAAGATGASEGLKQATPQH